MAQALTPDPFVHGDFVALVGPRRIGKTQLLTGRLVEEVQSLDENALTRVIANFVTPVNVHGLVTTLDDAFQAGMLIDSPIWLYLDNYSMIPENKWNFVLEELLPLATKIRLATSPGPMDRVLPPNIAVHYEHP
jgi:hypothetical protein